MDGQAAKAGCSLETPFKYYGEQYYGWWWDLPQVSHPYTESKNHAIETTASALASQTCSYLLDPPHNNMSFRTPSSIVLRIYLATYGFSQVSLIQRSNTVLYSVIRLQLSHRRHAFDLYHGHSR